MKKQLFALGFGMVLLSGCSTTLPVRGQIQNSNETFTGTVKRYIDGTGKLTIVSSTGAKCTGNFNRKGEGVFTCDDGRGGPFEIVSTCAKKTGAGDLGGQHFTFTIGD